MESKNSEVIDLPGKSQPSKANPNAAIELQASKITGSTPQSLYLGASMELVTVQRAPGQKSDRTFTCFRDLAKEIRLKIWQYCFPRNRNVIIRSTEDYDWLGDCIHYEKLPNDSLYLACEPRIDLITPNYHRKWDDVIDKNAGRNHWTCWHWETNERTSEPPITLQVNRESREETLNFYVVLYPGLTKKPIYFNPTLDIIFFRKFFSTDFSEWNRFSAIAQFARQIQTNVHTVGTLHMRRVNTLHTKGVPEKDDGEGDEEGDEEYYAKYHEEAFKEITSYYLGQEDDEYPMQIANRNTHDITWDFEEGSVDATAFTDLALILLSTSTYGPFARRIHDNCDFRNFIEKEFRKERKKDPDVELPRILHDSEYDYGEPINFKKERRGT